MLVEKAHSIAPWLKFTIVEDTLKLHRLIYATYNVLQFLWLYIITLPPVFSPACSWRAPRPTAGGSIITLLPVFSPAGTWRSPCPTAGASIITLPPVFSPEGSWRVLLPTAEASIIILPPVFSPEGSWRVPRPTSGGSRTDDWLGAAATGRSWSGNITNWVFGKISFI